MSKDTPRKDEASRDELPVDAGHGPGFDRQGDLPDGDFHSYTDRTVEKDDDR